MVTKHRDRLDIKVSSLILAKIHMVTKLVAVEVWYPMSLILAKIHMVTKHKS